MPVKRGGRSVVTVEIFLENYEKIKKRAIQKRLNIKEYINDFLQVYLEKEEFLARVAPSLSVDSYEGNRITLKDVKKKILVLCDNVSISWGIQPVCHNCHVNFGTVLPAMARKPASQNRLDSCN